MFLYQLEHEREQLKYKERDYVKRFGFEITCQTPGSLWLWKKEWKGQIILVSIDTAISMCRMYFDEQPECGEEDGD